MAATKQDIQGWFDRGVKKQATHMIVACDTFDYEDYPVYVEAGEDVRQKVAGITDRVMEVYNLAQDRDIQLGQHRAFNY